MRTFFPIWILFTVTLAVHHAVLWIDHILWDEVSFYKMAREHDLAGKLAALIDQGIASVYYFYYVFEWFSNPTWALRVAAFLSIWAIACVLFHVFTRYCSLPPGLAIGAAAVTIAYPSYQMYANAGAAIYIISLALFSFGTGCYFRGISGQAGGQRWWLVVATVLWVVSFMQQWLLPWFYGLFAAILVSRQPSWWRQQWHDTTDRAMLARLHLLWLATPFLCYYYQRKLFPLTPYFSGYSVPKFTIEKNLVDVTQAVTASLGMPFFRVAESPGWFWIAAAIGGGIGLILLRRRRERGTAGLLAAQPVSPRRLIAAGVILLAAGLLPFVASGKPPAVVGPESRFSILVAPSLSVIAAGCILMIRPMRFTLGRHLLAILSLVLLTAFACQHARNYIDWQACAIKDHAIVAALRRWPAPLGVNFFVVSGDHLEHTYVRRHYDWGRILYDAWGGAERIAVTRPRWHPIPRHYYTPLGISRDEVADFRQWMGYGNPGPPDNWCTIEFDTIPEFDFSAVGPIKVVLADLRHRLELEPESRQSWLEKFVTHVKISTPQAYPFSSEALTPQAFAWANSPGWRPLDEHAFTPVEPVTITLHWHESTTGTFSIMPLGRTGFAIRCDAVPTNGAPTLLNIKIDLASPAPLRSGPHGIACDYAIIGDSTAPKLVWITPGDHFTEGSSPQRDVASIESWVAEPPVRAWLTWPAHAAGEVIQIRQLKEGQTNPDDRF